MKEFMSQKNPHLDKLITHAVLGERLVELVRESGLLRRKPGRKRVVKKQGRKAKRSAAPPPRRRRRANGPAEEVPPVTFEEAVADGEQYAE